MIQLEEGEVSQFQEGEMIQLEEGEVSQLQEGEMIQLEEGQVSQLQEGEMIQLEEGEVSQLDLPEKEDLDQPEEENAKHAEQGKLIGSSPPLLPLDSLPSPPSSPPSQDPPSMQSPCTPRAKPSPLPHSSSPCSLPVSSTMQSSLTSQLSSCPFNGTAMDVGYAPPAYSLRLGQTSEGHSDKEPPRASRKRKAKKPDCLRPITDGATGQQVKELSPSGTPCSSTSHSSSPSPLLAQLSPEFPKLGSLAAPKEQQKTAIPPSQRELLPHVSCPLPLPAWLASALVRVQSEQTHHKWRKVTRKRKCPAFVCTCPQTLAADKLTTCVANIGMF